ncbi:MAG: acyl-CoA dehydrogenase family protein [Gemmatimonadota bacterium]|nr:acyl-CoA dehydrogenase family protein [Gemmatimonadota bacterium]
MDFNLSSLQGDLRQEIRAFCEQFPAAYWRKKDAERAYPHEVVEALTKAGYLSALIPKSYGGLGLGVTESSIILEEINRSGGNSGAFHGQMYIMGALLKHGSEAQKATWLPRIANGSLRLQAFSVTESEAGSDTARIRTFARREGDYFVINGHKNWTSRIEQSDLMLLLARTSILEEGESRKNGLSLFLVDLRAARKQTGALRVKSVNTMMNYETYQVTYKEMIVPAENMIGKAGNGFQYIIDGWNAERILLAAECIGDGHWFIDTARTYAKQRKVFEVPIGKNQGVQFPLARAYANLTAADLIRYKAAWKFDRGEPCGAEANMAKLLASEASWKAANICLDTHGGYGFVDEFDIERKFRETRLYKVAPVNNNLILSYIAIHVLGLPRSY